MQPVYDCLVRQAETEHRRVLLSLLEQDAATRLLDLGCGDGDFTLQMARMIGTKQVYGVEIVEPSICRAASKGICVCQSDLNRPLPLASRSVNVIVASQVIEHVGNTDTLFREIWRVLVSGGYAVITTPNLASVHNILFLLLGRQPPTASVSDEILVGTWYPGEKSLDSLGKQPSHRRVFTPRALKELLEYHGFRAERLVGSGFFPLPTILARVMSRIDLHHATHITAKARKVG